MKDPQVQAPEPMDPQAVPEYEPPEVVTYTDEEVLEEMGPAQAVTGIIDL